MDNKYVIIIIIAVVYLIGYFTTLMALIKYAKSWGIGDYDEEKTYADYDDYNSNDEAWTSFSVIWPVFILMGLFIFGVKSLIKLTNKLNKK